jgi:hypothetical protein
MLSCCVLTLRLYPFFGDTGIPLLEKFFGNIAKGLTPRLLRRKTSSVAGKGGRNSLAKLLIAFGAYYGGKKIEAVNDADDLALICDNDA